MEETLKNIYARFDLPGDFDSATPINSGHINDTFLVQNQIPGHTGFCFQRINSFVFPKVDKLMDNMVIVTRHLADRNPEKVNLKLFQTKEGKSYFTTKEGDYWRVFNFIDNSHVFQQPPDEAVAFEGGMAFGNFLKQVSELDPSRLFTTIPRFHDFSSRWKQYGVALETGKYDRRKEAAADIFFVKTRADEMAKFSELLKGGKIPGRITHNDTKFNNILFSKDNKALCVIDLDTVMPGSALYDYGDAIRTVSNAAAEDETDLDAVIFHERNYSAYTEGYLEACVKILTPPEKANMNFAARYMTFLIGLRFLTDFLLEDIYYKTCYPNHNLIRARVQFHLLKQMERYFKKK